MITEKQREERKLGIGGSDMPIIMGLSSYKTPYQLYLEKTGQVDSPDDMSDVQYWGHQLEEVVRNEFSKRNNVSVEIPETFIHKCSSSFMAHEWGEDGSDIIPLRYLVQVAYYCAVMNADCAYMKHGINYIDIMMRNIE